jgi:hypothetical protein
MIVDTHKLAKIDAKILNQWNLSLSTINCAKGTCASSKSESNANNPYKSSSAKHKIHAPELLL